MVFIVIPKWGKKRGKICNNNKASSFFLTFLHLLRG